MKKLFYASIVLGIVILINTIVLPRREQALVWEKEYVIPIPMELVLEEFQSLERILSWFTLEKQIPKAAFLSPLSGVGAAAKVFFENKDSNLEPVEVSLISMPKPNILHYRIIYPNEVHPAGLQLFITPKDIKNTTLKFKYTHVIKSWKNIIWTNGSDDLEKIASDNIENFKRKVQSRISKEKSFSAITRDSVYIENIPNSNFLAASGNFGSKPSDWENTFTIANGGLEGLILNELQYTPEEISNTKLQAVPTIPSAKGFSFMVGKMVSQKKNMENYTYQYIPFTGGPAASILVEKPLTEIPAQFGILSSYVKKLGKRPVKSIIEIIGKKPNTKIYILRCSLIYE